MLERGARLLVGVSGGPDSVSLLHILNLLKKRLDITLCVAHIDHGIRGSESARDARFVKKLSKSLGLKFFYEKLKPVKIAKSKLSTEEYLREKRYAFFKKKAAKLKIHTVATAHTMDDQAETVMMRIIKGASLKGIVGIHPVRRDGNIKFIRPFIETEKKDLVAYLKRGNFSFRIDRTNSEKRFLRNRIRSDVLPELAKINPRIKRSLSNLAESLREDFEFIEEEKTKRRFLIRSKRAARYILLRDLLLQPKALQKEMVREAFCAAGGNIKKMTFRHWKDINNFLQTKAKGKSLDLPGSIRMQKSHDRLTFTRRS